MERPPREQILSDAHLMRLPKYEWAYNKGCRQVSGGPFDNEIAGSLQARSGFPYCTFHHIDCEMNVI